ncbi:hypothetical protein C8R43DRAFT_1033808 [Mycena crocata]|nr:hypothetical protein C8R43DRAFT_1033808 [Mycena crocata]
MTETIEPPSYDGYGFESLVASSHGTSDLPTYTRRPTPPPRAVQAENTPRKFQYEIKNRSGKPWTTLFVHGDHRLTKVIPTIMEGSNFNGSVTLNLQSTETIQAVYLLIKGEIVNGTMPAVKRHAFLDVKHILWSPAGDASQASKNSMGKLKGEYDWPFSVELPKTYSKKGETFRLPHTFLDRLAYFSVQYTAELRIARGKLRPDDKVIATFGYFSMQQPSPPSPLRQLAYQENSPLLGPDADPEGWYTQPFSIKGTIFSSRMIDVKCSFSLANPLSYTRSASIPCAITLESQDSQALDLLSSPSACIIYLERRIQDHSEGWRNTHDGCEPCGQAIFWPSTEGATEDAVRRRRLMGEIHLRANLQPSSAVFGFAVEYSVVVFPMQAAGFKATDNEPLIQQVVEITTRYAPGPRQKTYTPPTYEGKNTLVDYYYYSLAMENTAGRGVRGRMSGKGFM